MRFVGELGFALIAAAVASIGIGPEIGVALGVVLVLASLLSENRRRVRRNLRRLLDRARDLDRQANHEMSGRLGNAGWLVMYQRIANLLCEIYDAVRRAATEHLALVESGEATRAALRKGRGSAFSASKDDMLAALRQNISGLDE